MANFVESATLIVRDESTAKLRKINKEIRDLLRAAKSLKSKSINLKVSISGGTAAMAQLSKIKSAPNTKTVKVKVSTSGFANANAQLQKINKTSASKKVTVKVGSQGIAQVATALQRLIALKKRVGASVNVPVTGGGGRGPPPSLTSNGSGVFGNSSVLKDIIIAKAIFTVGTAIINGVREGYTDQQIAAASIRAQQLDPETKSASQKATDEILLGQSKKGTGSAFSRADIENLLAENIPVTLSADGKPDIDAAKRITEQLLRLAETQIAMGISPKDALAQSVDFSKAGESSGNFTSPETGAFDPKRMMKFFETLQKIAPQIGKEFTGSFVRQAVKYLRASKYGMTPEALMGVMMMNEETGSTASVGYNQALKQLMGGGTKKGQAELERLGLITTKEVDVGSVGGKKTKERVIDGTIDDELLRSNAFEWVNKNLIPAMIKDGLDPNKANDVQKFVRKVATERTAQDFIISSILRSQELQKQISAANARNADPAVIDAQNAQSGLVAVQGVVSGWEGALGQMVAAFDNILILPASKTISNFLAEIQSYIAGPDGKPDPARAGIVAGGGIAAALGGGLLISKLMGMMTGIPANTIATGINTAALNANTIANGGSLLGKGGAAATGAAGGGLLAKARSALLPLAAALALLSFNKGADPNNPDKFPDDPAKDAANKRTAKFIRDRIVKEILSSERKDPFENSKKDPFHEEPMSKINERTQALLDKGSAKRNAEPTKVEARKPLPVVAPLQRPTASGIPPKSVADDYVASLIAKKNSPDYGIAAQGAGIRAAFDAGGAAAAAKVQASGGAFGSTAGGGILAVAGQFGAIVAAAISAAAANVTVNAQAPRLGVPAAPGRVAADTGRVGTSMGPR